MRNYQGFVSQVYFLHIGSRSHYNLFAFYLIEIDKAPVCLIPLHAYAYAYAYAVNPEIQTKDETPTCLRPAQAIPPNNCKIRWLRA
ncbi:hypothetical protein BofuT4_P014140.1 [Botrytis cinerea T4]|uniref:Uncharacterized protein n=1 Tax=Botryotinia fuckeliana (strain T4) TaxID=999810 RepID=G2XN30_BOTF4|nr:hypothetical protein BofuT4_P014140.1 [Botrytis cinerea T4]